MAEQTASGRSPPSVFAIGTLMTTLALVGRTRYARQSEHSRRYVSHMGFLGVTPGSEGT